MTLFKRFLLIDPLVFLSLTIILYILRMVGPYVNYVFIPFLFIYFIFTTIHYFYGYKSHNSLSLLIYQLPFLIISLFFIVGIISSSGFILFAFKELLNVPIFIFLIICFFLFAKDKESFNRFTNIFCKQFILFASIVSILGLTKFILQLQGIGANILNFFGQVVGTSLTDDYSFYCLFSFIGLIALIFNSSKFRKTSFTLIFILLNSNILFSGSRRGIILLLIIWVILFFFGLNLNFNQKQIGKKIVFFCVIFLVFEFSFHAIRKNNFIKLENQSIDLNSRFQNQVQYITTQLVFRYLTAINSDKSYGELFNELWVDGNIKSSKINYDEYDYARGENNLLYNGNFNYGLLFWKQEAKATKHEIVKTPYGNGVRISRFDGDNENWSLLYTGRNIVFYSNHNFVLNFKFKVVSGKGIPFQIGFKTDDSFWGNRNGPSLQINTTDLENGWKQGTCSYTFQKSYSNIFFLINSQRDSTIIEITDIKLMDSDTSRILTRYSDEILSDNQKINKYLILYDSIVDSERNIQNKIKNLFSNGDFRIGTQCWLPAADSTQHEIIETPFGKGIRVSRTNGDGGYWSLLYDGRPIIYYAGHRYRLRFNYKVEKGETLPFNIGWWVNEANQGFWAHRLSLTIRNINDGWKEATCSYKFKETHNNLHAFLNSLQDNSVVDISNVELIDLDRIDSIPIFVDQIREVKQIPEVSIIDTIDFRDFKNKLYSERTNRWYYSWVVFNDSLSIPQKIFGGGFDYLEMFGKKFGIARYDKPHNPFISAFLYSGILGGLAFIWFMIMVIVNYLHYLKRHLFFFISFVVTFIFVFFSDTSLFNTPLFTFLCLVPFFTKYLYLKEKYNDSQKIPFKKILFW